jgi:hypothetical protein
VPAAIVWIPRERVQWAETFLAMWELTVETSNEASVRSRSAVSWSREERPERGLEAQHRDVATLESWPPPNVAKAGSQARRA